MQLSNEVKIQALIELFSQSYQEIVRYRDLEWKISYWTVGLLAGIVTATQLVAIPVVSKTYIQSLLFIAAIIISIYSAWHIHFVHKNLTWNRSLRIKCEKYLKMFDNDEYGDKSLLPVNMSLEKVSYWNGAGHLVSWWGIILLTTIYTLYSIMHLKTI